jgi:hypothetical protein
MFKRSEVMALPKEKDLDVALETAFRENRAFVDWFLSKTKFNACGAVYNWSRSNYPWGKAELKIINVQTGEDETISREGETDVLVVFELPDNKSRFALHLENKIASGSFTDLQPEVYRARAEKWKGNPKYGNYIDWETVLVAPHSFFDRNKTDATKFDSYVSHEDIARYVPLFGLLS